MLLQLGELLLDVVHKGGAARAGEEALFGQLGSLGVGYHVRAQGGLYHVEEAQLLDTGDNLAQLGVAELAGDGGRHHSVELVVLVVVALFNHVHHVQDKGLIHNGAKGALVDAGAAGDAGLVVDVGSAAVRHADGFNLAGVLAGALLVDDGAVGADLGALATLYALGFVNVGMQVLVKGDGPPPAGVLAAVCDAPRQASLTL